MSDPQPPDDFQHLPKADAENAEIARTAKAALWKKISEQRRQLREEQAASAEAMAAEETPPVTDAEPASSRSSSRDEWAELFTSSDQELEAALIPAPAAPPPPSRKRSIIRRSPPATIPEADLQPDVTNAASKGQPNPDSSPAEVAPSRVPEPQRATPSEKKTSSPHRSSVETAASDTPHAENTQTTKPSAPQPVEGRKDKEPKVHFLVALARQKWVQWGGASLSLSLGIHALVLGIGGFLVVSNVMLDKEVDFLPGGTQQGQQASQALEHKIQQKKNPWLKKPVPLRKIAAVGSISDIVLPDEVPDLLDLPSASDMLSSSKLGGAGLGGGGFGKGMGLGAKDGMVFQPLSMFGREIKAKRLALVLDVSSSMAPFLPRVIEEVDKVAKGSIILLYPGCGLDSPPPKGLTGKEIYRTSGPEFERFWRMGAMSSLEEARKFKFSRSDPIPSESIYTVLSKRPQTYFIHYVGIGYTWLALLSDQVRSADALYWFSDFQDHVDFQQLDVVRENLLRRQQKLYIQPYQHGSAFDLVKSQLVVPSGGDVIETVFE